MAAPADPAADPVRAALAVQTVRRPRTARSTAPTVVPQDAAVPETVGEEDADPSIERRRGGSCNKKRLALSQARAFLSCDGWSDQARNAESEFLKRRVEEFGERFVEKGV